MSPLAWAKINDHVMCGRFTITVSASILADLFALDEPPGFVARFNVAPTQMVPIVRTGASGSREWAVMRWGLVPRWAKDMSIGSRMINARSETVADKPSFRSAFAHRRCLVPTDGFYEWRKTGSGKQPHHIRFRDRRPFALAGLWERWSRGEGEPVESFTILTTRPNDVAAAIHDRMPVILEPDAWDRWLDPGRLSEQDRQALLEPFRGEDMEASPVSRRVNSPHNDDPACLDPPG
jgi:putative SOS response-associated peptidase YedK